MSQEQLREAMADFGKCCERMQKNSIARNKLLTQLHENEVVLKELESLDENSIIYKSIGPLLVRQSRDDANATVTKRVSYIRDEVERCQQLETDVKKEAQVAAQNVETLQKKLIDRQKQRV